MWSFTRKMLVGSVFALLLMGVALASAQDVAGEISSSLSETQVSWVNPFTGEGVSVTLFRLLYIVAGVLLLVMGWRAYKVALGVIGFAIGSGVGASIVSNAGGGPALVLMASLLVGIIASMLAVFAYYVAVVIFGGYVGVLLTGLVLPMLGITAEPSTNLLFLIVGAVLGGALALALSFELVVVLTSYLGAVMLAAGLRLTAQPNGLVWVAALFILGVVVQIAVARSMNENAFRRREIPA
jgi:hypothetical protein